MLRAEAQVQIEANVAEVRAIFEDGFQWGDLAEALRLGVEFAETFTTYSGAEKKEVAVALVRRFIEITDIAWIPDVLVDPILNALVPSIIDLVIGAANGELEIRT